MSIQKMAIPWAATGITPQQKLVWLVIADAMEDEAPSSLLKLKDMEAPCCMGRDELLDCVVALVKAGKINIMVSLA